MKLISQPGVRRELESKYDELVEPVHREFTHRINHLQPEERADVTRPRATIFAIPKPFKGHIGIIQRNAIQSWKRLCPSCEIILCGVEEGTAEVAAELGVTHLADLGCNEFGTPFLHTAFQQVRQIAQGDYLCYVNCDIILLDDFSSALAKLPGEKCLLVGQRWDVDIHAPLNFADPAWSHRLHEHVNREGSPHSLWGVDYFVFPRNDVLDRLPPFVVGRPGWDNWVIYSARERNIPVVDASRMIRAVHQNHDYNHVPMRSGERWAGPEAKRQVRLLHDLMNGSTMRFAIVDATHTLTPDGIEPIRTLGSLRRAWSTLGVLNPRWRTITRILNPVVYCADWVWSWFHPQGEDDGRGSGAAIPTSVAAAGSPS